MYIPVAEATYGATPRLKIKGLKIIPPPTPNAPDASPPEKAKHTSLTNEGTFITTSLGTIPYPTLIFNYYSAFTARIEKKLTIPHRMRKDVSKNQSIGAHLLSPISE